jgi:small subunit ribosomal protein S6
MLHSALFLPRLAPSVPERRLPAGPTQTEGREAVGNVIAYEILLMLDPELADERQSEIVSRTREALERGGGSWGAHDVWGRRKLAYEIDHKDEGSYHLLTFESEPETLDEISRVLRITDGVMRHMAVRQVPGSRAQPPPAPPREAVQTAE